MTSEAPASTAGVTTAGNEKSRSGKVYSVATPNTLLPYMTLSPVFPKEKLLVSNVSEVFEPLAIWLLYQGNRVAQPA